MHRLRDTEAARPTLLVAVVGLAVLAPFALDTIWTGILVQVLIAACAALGLTLLFGFAGQMSLAQASFAGVGAYATGILTLNYGLSPWWGLPVGVSVAVVLAAVIGYPILRLQGLYLVLATAALNLAAIVIVVEWEDFTGGAVGLPGLEPLSLFGWSLLEPRSLYYLALTAFAILFLLAYRLVRSPVGAALAALRHDERAAELTGISVSVLKTQTFVLSAAFAGISGFLLAEYLLYVPPEAFGIVPALYFKVMVVIGGMRSLTGALIGAAFVTAVPQLLPDYPRAQEFTFVIAFLLITVFAPRGLAGVATDVWRKLAGPSRRRLADLAAKAKDSTQTTPPVSAQPDQVANRWQAQTRSAQSARLPVLEGNDLAKRFGGVQALSGVNLTVHEAEIFAIIGPNGAGKTTLLNVVTGIWRPDRGHIRLTGKDITGSSPWKNARQGLARTLQTPVIFPEMSVLENVVLGHHAVERTSFGAALVGLKARRWEQTARDQARQLLALLGLEEDANRIAHELPLGKQRLVEIGRALATQPRVILLDEPAAGLAQPEVIRLAGLLRTAATDLGIAVCLVEHNMQLVMGIAERILVMQHGQYLLEGTPAEVRAHPEVIEAYLGSRRGQRDTTPST